MVINDNEVQPVSDFNILVVKATKGTLSPIYVWGHENGVAGAPSVKVAFAHVNLGAENDTDPCNCLGDLYQWGRKKDGHQVRTSASYPTNDTSAESGIATAADLDVNGQIAEGNAREGKFIKQTDYPMSWRPINNPSMVGLWGDNTTETSANYNQARGTADPCPTGWKVPSQKQWSAIYQGNQTNGAPEASTSGSTWTKQGKFTSNGGGSTSGYKVADALYLPTAGYRHLSWGSLHAASQYGDYWSSTIHSSSHTTYKLYFYNNTVLPGDFGDRANAYVVRCVPE
ncbi:hypothetical protein D0T84_19785 [Dysgonomonas sp. 521]|uniref:FISUMP domain-containing protein n=1 Tax=Dysgonomonas sp. 521 TaxID=2302932 RepID=UPI0013D33200|nr:FISUMP domain-containing protein [Dysgonomonas sp. 521]NDV97125.1 hypothetical protein [Dysgonomonas sp. 521]